MEDVNKLKEGKFDAMLMTDFLHHISPPEQDKAIAYASGNLKKGAKLIVKDIFKRHSFMYFIYYCTDKYLLNFGDDVYYFSEKSIMERLRDAGFKVTVLNKWKKAFTFEIILVCEKR